MSEGCVEGAGVVGEVGRRGSSEEGWAGKRPRTRVEAWQVGERVFKRERSIH